MQHWNNCIFGNVFFDKSAVAELEVQRLEVAYERQPTLENRTLYHAAQAEYNKASKHELLFWEKKPRVKWLQSGDANTAYFHNIVKDIRHRQYISRIHTPAGVICVTEEAIQGEAVSPI